MKDAHVYLMTTTGLVKIGVATSVGARWASLQVGCPTELVVVASRRFGEISEARIAEKHMHRVFSDRRIRGEWFNVSVDEAVAELAEYGAMPHVMHGHARPVLAPLTALRNTPEQLMARWRIEEDAPSLEAV